MLGSGNPSLTAKLLSDFRSSARPGMQPLQRAPRDPATDIYRLLDNYAADITKAGEKGRAGTLGHCWRFVLMHAFGTAHDRIKRMRHYACMALKWMSLRRGGDRVADAAAGGP